MRPLLRLGDMRNIVGYDDLRICHLLGKLESGQRLGLQLLKELGRLDVVTVVITKILRKRSLLIRLTCMRLKEAEDISCAVQNVFDSLATYVVFWVPRGCCHEKALRALEEITERREDLP